MAGGTALLASGLAVTAPSASADPDECVYGCSTGTGGGGTYSAQARSITITVTGGPDAGGGTGSSTVAAPYYCYYRPFAKASEMGPNPMGGEPSPERGYDPATGLPADIAQRLLEEAAGSTGQYWIASCGIEASPDWPLDAIETIESGVADDFFAENGIAWVDPATPLPELPDPLVEVLLDVAQRQVDVPEPEVQLNPAGNSYVNLPTWVWAEGQTYEPITIRAESGDNWAEITLTPSGLQLDAPYGTQIGSCDTGGTPYTAGTTTDCAMDFGRSSATAGTWPMTVSAAWTALWVGSNGGGGPLPGANPASVVQVPVAEVQTLVRR